MAKSKGFKHEGLHSSGLTGPSSSRRALPLSVLRLSRPAPSPPCIPEIRNRSIKFLGRDPRRASREGQGTAASTRARSQARGRADRLTAPGAVGQWERAHRGCLATRWRRGGAGGDAGAVDAERARRGGRELGARGPSIARAAPGERPVGRRRASRPLGSPRGRVFESRHPGWGVFVSEEDLRDSDSGVPSPQRPRSLSFLPPYPFITHLLPLSLRISLCGFPELVDESRLTSF